MRAAVVSHLATLRRGDGLIDCCAGAGCVRSSVSRSTRNAGPPPLRLPFDMAKSPPLRAPKASAPAANAPATYLIEFMPPRGSGGLELAP